MPPRWRLFLHDSYDTRPVSDSIARSSFCRFFEAHDYALTQAGDDVVRMESTPMLHRNVTLDMFAINPSAVISADVPHGMTVPAPPVVQ